MSIFEDESTFGENPNVSTEELEAHFAQKFPTETATEEVPEETPEETPAESEVEETTTESTEEPTEEEEVFFDLGNKGKISRSRAEAYLEFEERLRTDPGLQKAVSDYLDSTTSPSPGESAVPTTGTAPGSGTADLDEYKDDPIVGPLIARIAQLEGVVNQTQGSIQAQQAANTQAIVNRAKSSFKDQYNLTTDEIDRIEAAAVRMGTVPAFMSGLDPITGMPVKPDPLNAVTRAMEIAYQQLPEVRKAAEDRKVAEGRNDRVRKTKLSAISGPGSTSRKTPVPVTQMNESDRRDAMVREVAEMMNGNSGN